MTYIHLFCFCLKLSEVEYDKNNINEKNKASSSIIKAHKNLLFLHGLNHTFEMWSFFSLTQRYLLGNACNIILTS